MRVVTIPSAWGGESCVIRLLDQTRVRSRLATLGFSRAVRLQFDNLLSIQGGVILATGPTGSGKTTTLYSALKKLTTPGVKTITVEDPVEYRLSGMLQVQVNRAANFDFAAALRAILRADPDVLLVGEIRDPETARTAMGAALTGQVVLASLHTSTAATAPLRLVDLGIEPFMASAAIRGVINQRLLRRLCRQCRTPYVPRLSILNDAQWPFERPERLWGPRQGGCEACFGSGYKGRAVVAEVIKMNDEIRSAVMNRAEPAVIEVLAVASGMVPIRHDALQLARQGATSLEEIARVLGDS
jgi:type II secretory ATPase GspE/PulE/Tfp pilus assembly ATPase PilB-like protein